MDGVGLAEVGDREALTHTTDYIALLRQECIAKVHVHWKYRIRQLLGVECKRN